jgi:hypothetical protein
MKIYKKNLLKINLNKNEFNNFLNKKNIADKNTNKLMVLS